MAENCCDKCKPVPQECPTCEPVCQSNLFSIGDGERKLFDSVAQELNQIVGTDLDYFVQDVNESTRDPLYDEPIERVFKGPYRVKAYVEQPSTTPEVREEGYRTIFDGSVWIARADFDALGLSAPSEGDVLRFWNTPFFNSQAVDGEDVPNRGYFFDVVDVDEDGHLNDTASFVGFKLVVRRRTEFTPERRLVPP